MALTITQKPLAEVSAGLSSKTPIGAALNTEQWQKQVPAALRDRAFLSAMVESVRALDEAQSGLQQVLDMVRGSKGEIAMDRSLWIAENQKLANKLGLRNADPDKRGGLQDYGSERRLALIYETQISSAQNRAYYLSGQDPDVLDAWPAQELVRVRASTVPRKWTERWTAAGGKLTDGGRMIALKTDPIWREISRFRQPYPPFDFNSGMGLEEIDREEAEALGLIARGEVIEPSVDRDQEKMEASAKGMKPEMIEQLEKLFGDQIVVVGNMVRWKKGATAPPRMAPLNIPIDSPEKTNQIVSIQNANEKLQVSERQARRGSSEFRRAGESARASFEAVFPHWRGPSFSGYDQAVTGATEAQIAAASVGAKPLYFDPYGEADSRLLAAKLRRSLPAEVEVVAQGSHLYVYRPEALRPILDADPSFYRPNGESDLEAIVRVSERWENGDLLGYGARSWSEPGGAMVTLTNAAGYKQMFFVSRPAEAEYWARERAADIAAYTGAPVSIQIELP